MNLVRVSGRPVRRPLAAALLLALGAGPALTGCALGESAAEKRAESRLAPRFDAQHRGQGGKRGAKGTTRGQRGDAGRKDTNGNRGTATGSAGDRETATAPTPQQEERRESPSSAPTTPAAPPATKEPAGPLTGGLADARGDVRGGLGGAPDHVDVLAAGVTRADSGFTVRVDVAGALPDRASGSQVQNVAVFFDLDGDALVDYETWGTLSDNGWSGSYRTPDSAHFGADSGVQAHPQGSSLVLSFPLSHLEGARSFRWQVGSEWGTYEQVASGTTSSDRAGDGGVAFPSR